MGLELLVLYIFKFNTSTTGPPHVLICTTLIVMTIKHQSYPEASNCLWRVVRVLLQSEWNATVELPPT